MSIRVTFWGVRAGAPASEGAFAHHGVETSCIEIESGTTRFVLDAGSGLLRRPKTNAPTFILLTDARRTEGLHAASSALIQALTPQASAFTYGDLAIQTYAPDAAGVAVVVMHGERCLCYVASATSPAPEIANAAHGADLLIFGGRWQDGVRFKHELGAKLLAITDHPAALTDAALASSAADAAARHSNLFFARSGCSLDL
ncbi:MAG TPA: hypothetical protein VG943_11780 [Caulobacterales bacterium]|nr:hypothetical protein [Caulobacterales bacterium]